MRRAPKRSTANPTGTWVHAVAMLKTLDRETELGISDVVHVAQHRKQRRQEQHVEVAAKWAALMTATARAEPCRLIAVVVSMVAAILS